MGQGVAERLAAGEDELRALGMDVRIVGVVDPALGSIGSQQGLDPERLLAEVATNRSLSGYPGAAELPEGAAAVSAVDADVVLEMTPTDLQSGGPGLQHVRAALRAGMHVATSNKGPVALAWHELDELARQSGVLLRCEGTVMSGTPLLNVCDGGLRGAGVRSVRGILNGTCNYILSRMEDDLEYEEALAEAQRAGYAEADPAGDVDGWDAAAKVAILANLVLGSSLTVGDVDREGISDVGLGDVHAAAAAGQRLRLVGSVGRDRSGAVISPRVAVEELPASDPLAMVRGPGNLLSFDTDALGVVTIAGPGAGRAATGHALIADLIAIHRATS